MKSQLLEITRTTCYLFLFCLLTIAVGCQTNEKDRSSQQSPELNNLPSPDPEFNGKIGRTYHDSEMDPSLFTSSEAPKGAPNVLLVLIDDIGFGGPSAFGGSINTPVYDKLAANGLRYNRFHTTALCSPTRAALLTGRDHHNASTGTIVELSNGYPGYTGTIPKSTATMGKLLQENGYSTSWFGKNHNVADNVTSIVGPYQGRPNGLGFDYFYGFLGGETDQWYPTLFENQNPVLDLPTPEEGYHINTDLADKAINWMNYQKSIAPDRPFLLYFAPGAVHAPHQAPKEWIDKYKGKFDLGWDEERKRVFERQKELGIIPANTELTERPEELPSWDSFDDNAKKLLARQMETYAGFMEYTDYEIGRIVDAIEARGELDNTIIIYIMGDNGSSAEGGLIGTANEMLNLNGLYPTMEMNMDFYDEWGGPTTSPHFAVGWAWAMSTPNRWTKQVASHFGGTRNSLVVSWPDKIKEPGIRSQFHHVNDILPTILDIAGLEAPEYFNGVKQKPMDGVSMAYTFGSDGANAKNPKKTQYFEMFGHRAIYHEGWMASAFHNRVPWNIAGSVPFEDDKWELFDLTNDFSQANDLSAKNPEKLKELQDLFDEEAKAKNVYPLDDRFADRLDVTLRPSFIADRDTITFYPGATRLLEGSSPDTKSRSHSIIANINIPDKNTEGTILSFGGGTAGYGLYLRDGKFSYFYDWYKFKNTTVSTDQTIPTGNVEVRMDFNYDGGGRGKGADIVLYVNGKKAGSGRLEETIAQRFTLDGMDVGMDLGAPVDETYSKAFTGSVENVTFILK